MNELGSILQEARETKGVTLEQAHEATRIQTKFLSALEEGQYESLPTSVHIRGFLKNYARFLGLDPDPLIDIYESRHQQKPGSKPISLEDNTLIKQSQPVDHPAQPFFNPVNLSLNGNVVQRSESFFQIAIIVAVIVFIALLANRFLFTNPDSEAETEQALAEIQQNSEPIEESPVESLTATNDTSNVISTSRNSVVLPTSTPTRPALPATLEMIDLRLEITERSWFRVTIDNEVVFEGQGRQGEIYEWQALDNARLESGNAIGIFVTINNVRLGKLGGRGEIIDESWRATGS